MEEVKGKRWASAENETGKTKKEQTGRESQMAIIRLSGLITIKLKLDPKNDREG